MSVIRPGEPLRLTPNERQAVCLWEAHDQEMLDSGETVWETLAACSWSTLMGALWEERLLSHRGPERLPSLLNPWQERFLWIRILGRSPQGQQLLNLPAAGRLAAEAWSIVCGFELMDSLLHPPLNWNDETQVFLGWAEDFQEACRRHRWLDAPRLEATLAQALGHGSIAKEALPSQLLLSGFADLTPAQKRLLQACRDRGVLVEEQDTIASDLAADWCRTVSKDSESELRAAAGWIRRLLEQDPTGRPPRIGLVVPDLARARTNVTRLLDEVLQPGHLLPHREGQDSLYNVSLGLPLASWPVVADALSLLALDGRRQALPDLGVLFHSPFLAAAETEQASRALLEARLLRDGAYQVALPWVQKRATSLDTEGLACPITCPVLGEVLGQVLDRLQSVESSLDPSDWALEFKALLDLYGWPGERSLDSSEFQTVERWNELLAQFGSLDRIEPALTRREAVLALRRMAEESVYQPQAASGPIEVLGYLEAAGLPFDHLWLVGMHDGAWPQPSRPNPYLPNALQKAHMVPHSSAERELEFAQRLTEQLLRGAPHGVVSSSLLDGDRVLRPSLLVEHLPQRGQDQLPCTVIPALPLTIFESRRQERVLDPGPPAVCPGRRTLGGTSIFKLQAACPFRAFAVLRLKARPLEGVDDGLDAMQRGKILHVLLEEFWKSARSSRALTEWPPERLDEALNKAIEAALRAGKKERPDVLTGRFLQLERQRLGQLAREWLAIEAERAPFEVRDTERVVEFEFSGVHLRAIIDRIDRLADGSLVVIDYKTGPVHYNKWLGDRPEEPQLPLYGVATAEAFAGLAFAKLRTGEMGFSGISAQPDMLPGVDPSDQAGNLGMPWAERKETWREILTALAAQFHQGEFRVDPLKGRTTCRSCRLETLCRIDELESQR